jgi:hypothetical protein
MKRGEVFQGTLLFSHDTSHQTETNLAEKGLSLQRNRAEEHAPGYRGATIFILLFL